MLKLVEAKRREKGHLFGAENSHRSRFNQCHFLTLHGQVGWRAPMEASTLSASHVSTGDVTPGIASASGEAQTLGRPSLKSCKSSKAELACAEGSAAASAQDWTKWDTCGRIHVSSPFGIWYTNSALNVNNSAVPQPGQERNEAFGRHSLIYGPRGGQAQRWPRGLPWRGRMCDRRGSPFAHECKQRGWWS